MLPPYLGMLRPKVETPLSLETMPRREKKIPISKVADEYFIRKPDSSILFPKPNRWGKCEMLLGCRWMYSISACACDCWFFHALVEKASLPAHILAVIETLFLERMPLMLSVTLRVKPIVTTKCCPSKDVCLSKDLDLCQAWHTTGDKPFCWCLYFEHRK